MTWWNHSIHACCSHPILYWSNSYRGAGRLPAVTSSGRAATSAVRPGSYRPEGKAGPRSRHYICWRSVGGQSRPNLAPGAAPPWYLCLIFFFTFKKRPAHSWRTNVCHFEDNLGKGDGKGIRLLSRGPSKTPCPGLFSHLKWRHGHLVTFDLEKPQMSRFSYFSARIVCAVR